MIISPSIRLIFRQLSPIFAPAMPLRWLIVTDFTLAILPTFITPLAADSHCERQTPFHELIFR